MEISIDETASIKHNLSCCCVSHEGFGERFEHTDNKYKNLEERCQATNKRYETFDQIFTILNEKFSKFESRVEVMVLSLDERVKALEQKSRDENINVKQLLSHIKNFVCHDIKSKSLIKCLNESQVSANNHVAVDLLSNDDADITSGGLKIKESAAVGMFDRSSSFFNRHLIS